MSLVVASASAKAEDAVSIEAGPHRGVVCGRRSDRHRRARHGRQAWASCSGQQFVVENKDGRRRQYRRRRGREIAARRLHAADGDGVHSRHQSRPLQQDAVRSGARFRAGRAGRRDADACSACILRFPRPTSRASSRWSRRTRANTPTAPPASARSFICAASSSRRWRAGSTSLHVPYRGSAPMMSRPGRRPDFHGVRRHADRAAAGAVRRDPRARRRHGGAHAGDAGAADLAGAGTEGLRVLHLERDPRAGRHAAADRRRLSGAINKALDDPAVFKRLQEAGVDPTPGRSPKETAEFIKAELAKWARSSRRRARRWTEGNRLTAGVLNGAPLGVAWRPTRVHHAWRNARERLPCTIYPCVSTDCARAIADAQSAPRFFGGVDERLQLDVPARSNLSVPGSG